MARLRNAGKLIGQIYDTVDNLGAWEDVLTSLADAMGAERGLVSAYPTRSAGEIGFAVSARIDPAAMTVFREHHVVTPWSGPMLSHPIGVPVASDAYVPFDMLRRSAFYGEVLAPQDDAHGALFRLGASPTYHFALCLTRSRSRGAFQPDELALTEPLLPHLERAARLRLTLDQAGWERAAALDALDRLSVGIVLLDPDGRPVFANRAAQVLSGDGVLLGRDGIKAQHRDDNRRLAALVASAMNGEGGVMAISRPSGALPLAVLAAPLHGSLARKAALVGLQGGGAVVTLSDPERQANPPVERLVILYGLTPAEARVVLAVAAGGTLAAVAARLGLRPDTVKTHLAHAYAKLDISDRAMLVRLLAASALAQP